MPATKVASVGHAAGRRRRDGAILPNGRRSRMRIIPTVAPISEVNRLRSVVIVNEKRQAVATADQLEGDHRSGDRAGRRR